jgi:hypothetical protein
MGAQNQGQKWRNPNAPPTWEQQVRHLLVDSYMRANPRIQPASFAARQLRESVAARAGFDLRDIEVASWKGLKLRPGAAEFLQCWCPGCSIGSNNRFTITTRPPGGGGPVRYLGCYVPIPSAHQGMASPEANRWELDADELRSRLQGLLNAQMENSKSWAQTKQPLLSTSSSSVVRIPPYFPNGNVNSKAKGNNTRVVIPRKYMKYYPGIYPHASTNVNEIQESNLEMETRQSWAQTGEQFCIPTPSHPIVYGSQLSRVKIPNCYPKYYFDALFANFEYSSPEESEQDENGAGDDEPTERFPAYVESPEMLEEIERENRNATNSQPRTWADVLRMNNNSTSNSRTNSNMEPNEQEMQAHASRNGGWGMNYRNSSWSP